jgi:hypothetical protein
MVAVLKTAEARASVGSNPTPSANLVEAKSTLSTSLCKLHIFQMSDAVQQLVEEDEHVITLVPG